jgi:hypothetical protein
MARIKYDPLRRDFIVLSIGREANVPEFYLAKICDSDINSAVEQAKSTPDQWVQIEAHKSNTLRAYR